MKLKNSMLSSSLHPRADRISTSNLSTILLNAPAIALFNNQQSQFFQLRIFKEFLKSHNIVAYIPPKYIKKNLCVKTSLKVDLGGSVIFLIANDAVILGQQLESITKFNERITYVSTISFGHSLNLNISTKDSLLRFNNNYFIYLISSISQLVMYNLTFSFKEFVGKFIKLIYYAHT